MQIYIYISHTHMHTHRLSRLSGYSQSKWVGETMVLKAMEQGLVHGSISRYSTGCIV